MKEISIALSMRVLVNLESLNMAESVGNVTRHRKAPVIVETDNGYRLIYVPVVSGMSLAHHYQLHLAKAAYTKGLNVTNMSLQGYFLKFSEDKVIKNYYPEVSGKVAKNKGPCNNEREIVSACTVADVGGFLYTDGTVKRTSRFSFTYMMPALDALKTGAAGVYPQLHVRYTPEAREDQALIYVDNAGALYTLSFLLEASRISKLDTCKALGQKPDDLGKDERVKRFQAAIEALVAMIGNMYFGAKRTRSMPHWKIESLVVVASKGITPFIPTPGHSTQYITETIKRLKVQSESAGLDEYKLAYYKAEEIPVPEIGEEHSIPEEALKSIAEWVIEKLT